jgi:8-oxo-dGTP diphosphatase
MTVHDGNGWTRCGRGHRHWGKHGAAGLLVSAPGTGGQDLVLLQQRSWWGSYGGAWGPPGGARDSHESAVRAALREAIEECAIDPRAVSVHGVSADDHGGWSYQTVLASADAPVAVAPVSEETSEVAWVPVADVERHRLHPGFAAQWPSLRTALSPLTVIVDAANVMGSRPDGWWRDRAGAAGRLVAEIGGLASRGTGGLPESVPAPPLQMWLSSPPPESGWSGRRDRAMTRSSGRPLPPTACGWWSPPTASSGPAARRQVPLSRARAGCSTYYDGVVVDATGWPNSAAASACT